MEHRVVYTRPYDAEVEYLESSGTQYIDTGIIPTSEYKYEVSVSKNADNTTEVVPLGSWNAWQNAMFGSDIKNSTIGIYILWGGGSYQTNIITNDWITLYGERGLSKVTLISTGEVLASREFAGNFTCNQSAYLFALNLNGSITYKGSCKISRAKIWNGDTLVRDFIPVRVGNIGYMYDRVSGKLFGNKGTGNFSLGSDVANPVPNIRRVFRFDNKRFVIPMPYDRRVEYIESTGTQWIDTDTIVNSLDSISVTLQFTQPNTPACIWSARNIPIKNTISLFRINNSLRSLRFDYGKTQVSQNAQGTNFSIEHEYKSVANKLYVDDVLKATNTAASFTAGKSVMVLASLANNNELAVTNFAYAKLYSVKIINSNNEILRDLIPVRKDNVGYMYDRVSGKLFGNAGTGNFILGNDIND